MPETVIGYVKKLLPIRYQEPLTTFLRFIGRMVVSEQIIEAAQNEGREAEYCNQERYSKHGLFSGGRAAVSTALAQSHIPRRQSSCCDAYPNIIRIPVTRLADICTCNDSVAEPSHAKSLRRRHVSLSFRSARLAAYAKLAGPAVLTFGARFLARGNAVMHCRCRISELGEGDCCLRQSGIRGSLEGTWRWCCARFPDR